MVALNLDAPCGEHTIGYCRWYCDWFECRHISDATRYEWARIGTGIEKPMETEA